MSMNPQDNEATCHIDDIAARVRGGDCFGDSIHLSVTKLGPLHVFDEDGNEGYKFFSDAYFGEISGELRRHGYCFQITKFEFERLAAKLGYGPVAIEEPVTEDQPVQPD